MPTPPIPAACEVLILYERHFDALFRYAAGRVGRQAAEDVVAETLVIAFTRRAAFDPESRLCIAVVDRDRYEPVSVAPARRAQLSDDDAGGPPIGTRRPPKVVGTPR